MGHPSEASLKFGRNSTTEKSMTCPGLGNDSRPWRSVLEVIRCPALSGYPIFTKVAKPTLRDRLLVVAQAGSLELNNHFVGHIRLREAAFDAGPVARVIAS